MALFVAVIFVLISGLPTIATPHPGRRRDAVWTFQCRGNATIRNP